MALVLDATVGGVASNSYETKVEAQNYFDSRLTVDAWDDADSQDVLLVMATRVLENIAQPYRRLVRDTKGDYYITSRQWTGAPATETQRLAWPRTGMYDRLGRAILPTVIPFELKEAESELAGQLAGSDRTLDNETSLQGITSVRAGSVSVSFKDMIERRVLPDIVWEMMPSSWFTDELIEPAMLAEFDVVS